MSARPHQWVVGPHDVGTVEALGQREGLVDVDLGHGLHLTFGKTKLGRWSVHPHGAVDAEVLARFPLAEKRRPDWWRTPEQMAAAADVGLEA